MWNLDETGRTTEEKNMNTQMLNLIVAFIATIILGAIIVPKLRKLKIGQMVRDDGPKSHLKKAGTPTMGGIILIIVLVGILGINAIVSTAAATHCR